MERPVFTPPFEALSVADAGEENRLALRRAVKMRAHLRDRGQTKFEIDVVDLSASGFRAETSELSRVGYLSTRALASYKIEVNDPRLWFVRPELEAGMIHDAEDFSRIHLLVKKLDDPHQLIRQPVSDEDQSDPACLEIRLDGAPELVRVEPGM